MLLFPSNPQKEQHQVVIFHKLLVNLKATFEWFFAKEGFTTLAAQLFLLLPK